MMGERAGEWLDAVRFGADGLAPVVVQDAATGAVLMLAWVDREAVRRTVGDGRAWFFSRSRRSYWLKGETSGNFLRVAEVRYDCDADALLYRVRPEGPACHTGAASCFHRVGWAAGGETEGGAGGPASGAEGGAGGPGAGADAAVGGPGPGAPAVPGILAELYRLVQERKASAPQGSYVARLLGEGRDRILQKVGEEAVEVLLAGKNGEAGPLVYELADLLFHLSVLLGDMGIPWERVMEELQRRRRPALHDRPSAGL